MTANLFKRVLQGVTVVLMGAVFAPFIGLGQYVICAVMLSLMTKMSQLLLLQQLISQALQITTNNLFS